ncbi:hypothetical protein Sjap_026105 [Stephania japonica]|uniref:DYW domain-containing protein n=1 Tax=Stephania japonica TaxID=461633 RepID=A0AAP0HG70_9MAGN
MDFSAATTSLCIIPPPNQTSKSYHRRQQNALLCFKSSPTLTTASATLETKIDYKARISRLCELGNLENALNLLYKAPKSQLELNVYCTVLQLCTENLSLEDGKRVHSLIKSSGLVVDEVVGSKLVRMYVNCGDLREGRRVFDEIGNYKEVFLWNTLINEYAKIRNFRESICLFKQMRRTIGVQPNSYTFTCVLKCFAGLGSVAGGEEAHGCLLKLGFDSYNTVGNSLISFYSKSKRIESAHQVFDELFDRDVISWNSMINAFVSNGLAVKGVEVFSEMRFREVEVDLATMVSVLPACAEMGMLLLGRAIHGHAIKGHKFDGEVNFNNSLMDMYAKCGDLGSATQVFSKMDKRCVVSWTSMISAYAREGRCGVAIELFRGMEAEGVEPDPYTITSVLHACASNGLLEEGKAVHKFIIKGSLQSNLFVGNALMEMYAKCGSMMDAQQAFDQMAFRDIISWNTMIGGYSKNCLPNEAIDLFMKMQQEFKPDGVTMSCILPACASLSALQRGREVHASTLRRGFSSDPYVSNALIDMYAKCGALRLARLLFDRMLLKDLVSWTVMIAGYGMHGRGKDSIDVFIEMRESGFKPDGFSFIAILYACSHSGLVDEGWRFFNIMRNEYKIEPKLEHYACMVDLFARAGRLTKAYKFIEKMPIEPDSTVWGALLCGCRSYRDVTLAEKVAERIFELEPENTGFYILLANIYAEAEKWERVKKLREQIARCGIRKKPAGCSWIEMNSKVHVFVAGDRSHPRAKETESLLEKVRMRMKLEGFLLNKRYALINATDMEKEAALCGHTEKLAIAYGILGLPPGKTVRVTKNLRVCGDCHEVAKFMSKMFMKEIVLRDSNRFHHFKDGRCSCRGY